MQGIHDFMPAEGAVLFKGLGQRCFQLIKFAFQLAQQVGDVAGDLVRRDGLERGQAFTSQQGGTFEGGAHGLEVVVDGVIPTQPNRHWDPWQVGSPRGEAWAALVAALTEAAETC